MNHKIQLLDCTLRDGGYVNDWNFGKDTTAYLFERLVSSKVDIIEVGCLDERRFVVGEWPWNFADFSTQQGPMRVGSCNRKGLFTRERTPKLAAHYFRDRWGKKEPNDR